MYKLRAPASLPWPCDSRISSIGAQSLVREEHTSDCIQYLCTISSTLLGSFVCSNVSVNCSANSGSPNRLLTYSFALFLTSSRCAPPPGSSPIGTAPRASRFTPPLSACRCQCVRTSFVLAVKNLALGMTSTLRNRGPENSPTSKPSPPSGPPNSSMFSSRNLAISSLRRWRLTKPGKSTGMKSWNCQHTTCGTPAASLTQFRHGRSLSQRTLREWQQKHAPSRRTCSALSLVPFARGPLRPLCEGRRASSKHSKGLGRPAWAVIDVGVMITNLPVSSAGVNAGLSFLLVFFFSTLPVRTLRPGLVDLLLGPGCGE